ncbi:MAG: hypothetical protein RJB11_1191 [Planctomycetota bacterium]
MRVSNWAFCLASRANGPTDGPTARPFLPWPNEFAGDFVEGSLPDGCISSLPSLARILPGDLVHATLRAVNKLLESIQVATDILARWATNRQRQSTCQQNLSSNYSLIGS